ncbi:MAG: hypothetical protein C7B44_09125 [Sulfobacillus thermosulfidooxidans]|nr:MAG: hypothetical protein C7B44_09125 [Sulfobacillus thermosulfidooxidans]
MIKVFPRFDEDLLVRLFHKGVKAQWSTADVDWNDPIQFSPSQSLALARMLTPVYLGEQSAMIGASVVLPQMANAGETSAQLYLSSFLMDEARHFEVLTNLYRRLGAEPLTIRQMPEMLRYHNRLRKGDRLDWVWGILISDIFAKNFYTLYAKAQPEALFGKLSGRILRDESRHQAFAEYYLKRSIPQVSGERVQALMGMKDELLGIMESMYQRLYADAEEVGMDGRGFLDRLRTDIETKARRIGLYDALPPSGRGPTSVRTSTSSPEPSANPTPLSFRGLKSSRCSTCFLALLCQTPLFQRAQCV